MRYRSAEAPRKYAYINRPVTRDEFDEAVAAARKQGLYSFDTRRMN